MRLFVEQPLASPGSANDGEVMFKSRLLKPTQTDPLNVRNLHTKDFRKGKFTQKCIHFVKIDIMTNCSNFESKHKNKKKISTIP